MAHSALITRSRVLPETVGRDVARLLAPTYAHLLDEQVPETFASILGRMTTGAADDIAQRLIDLVHSDDADLTWASYERQANPSRFIDPRWRKKPSLALQH
jgi:hypothetical protein